MGFLRSLLLLGEPWFPCSQCPQADRGVWIKGSLFSGLLFILLKKKFPFCLLNFHSHSVPSHGCCHRGQGGRIYQKANLTSHMHTVNHQSIKNKACNSTDLYKCGEEKKRTPTKHIRPSCPFGSFKIGWKKLTHFLSLSPGSPSHPFPSSLPTLSYSWGFVHSDLQSLRESPREG